MNILESLYKIKALVFDVDGVMTNGQLQLTEEGQYLRTFHIRDGYALRKAIEEGLKIAIISGGKSEGINRRLKDLGVTDIYLGIHDKLPVLMEWVARHEIKIEELAYMGDDILDLPCMLYAHIKACPYDAAPEIKAIANYYTLRKGGEGCVRELIEHVLKTQNHW